MKGNIDQNLISRLKKADRKAFYTVYSAYYGGLCSFANRYLRNPDEAEDQVQESFIALWQNKERLHNENHLKAFLYQTVKNKCLNIIKHQLVEDRYAEQNPEIEEELFFEEQMIHAEVITLLRNAIVKLPAKRQEIIHRSMRGIQNQEIAEELKISVNTVKLQKKLAYEFLRNALREIRFMLFF